jgi:hypothetical protein
VVKYAQLAQLLRGLDDFKSAEYSWGDGVIESCASGAIPRSSQHLWRGAGSSHHMQLMVDQLAALASN